MRFLFLVVLAACGTDTFEGGDAATDAPATNDAIGGGDAHAEASPPFDPSQLGSVLALWLDAADAKTAADAGDLVVAWPDHLNKYVTGTNFGANPQVCPLGLHIAKGPNNKPAVSFCGGNLIVKDASKLQLGSAPFYIAAVIAPPPTNDNVLFTKSAPGQTSGLPSGLTVLTPAAGGRMEGWLNGTANAVSQNALQQEFQDVAFVRTGTQIYVRVNSAAGSSATVIATDDVSGVGNDVGIGGYTFDTNGDARDVFGGSLAELMVVTDTGTIGLVEAYFKKKYNL